MVTPLVLWRLFALNEGLMSEQLTRGEIIGRVVGGITATLAVTAASFLWRIPQVNDPQAVPAVYLASAILLLAVAIVIFRVIVRRDYQQNCRLTGFPFFLQLLIWGLFFAFPCIYNPIGWAWSLSPLSQAFPVLGGVAWSCVGLGLVVVMGSLAWLGLSRSIGQRGTRLEEAGPYRLSRNPQLLGGLLLILGYVLLWPSWYALGWVLLYAALAHWMVLSEEEYLCAMFGEAYVQYCRRVPRYFGLLRKS